MAVSCCRGYDHLLRSSFRVARRFDHISRGRSHVAPSLLGTMVIWGAGCSPRAGCLCPAVCGLHYGFLFCHQGVSRTSLDGVYVIFICLDFILWPDRWHCGGWVGAGLVGAQTGSTLSYWGRANHRQYQTAAICPNCLVYLVVVFQPLETIGHPYRGGSGIASAMGMVDTSLAGKFA